MTGLLRWVAAIACLAAAALSALHIQALSGLAPGFRTGLFEHSALQYRCALSDEACDQQEFERLAGKAPLDARALSAMLSRRFEAGHSGGDLELAALLLRRDPRSELARILLAQQALEAGDLDRFLSLYLPMFRTDPRQSTAYAGVLAELSRDRRRFERLEQRILQQRPNWGLQYLQALAAEGGVALSDKITMYAEYPQAQPVLLAQLAREGNWQAAYIIFSQWISSGALAREAGVPPLTAPYNPGFVRSEAPVPFNWRLSSRSAEYLEEGGVYVFFQGRQAETFLSQTFPISPGGWRFMASMSGEASETGGWFSWRLTCADGSRRLASFDVRALGAASSPQAFDVTLEPGICEFVTLSLVGVPGMFPQPARVEVHEVRLDRLQAVEQGQ